MATYEIRLTTLAPPARTLRVLFHHEDLDADSERGQIEIVGPPDLRNLVLTEMMDETRTYYSPLYGPFVGGDVSRWGKVVIMAVDQSLGQQPLFKAHLVSVPEPGPMAEVLPEGVIP